MKTQPFFAIFAMSAGTLLAQDGRARDGFGPQGQAMRPSPIFTALDLDGDGVISPAELKNAAASLRKLDQNGDGQLTADEIRPRFESRRAEERDKQSNSPGSADDLVQTLMAFDRNADGKLSKDEVPERMQGLFDRGDTNHDSILTKDEILQLVQQQNSFSAPRERDGARPDFSRFDPLLRALDSNGDGVISSSEISNASTSLLKLDQNGDGRLTVNEVRPNSGRGGDPTGMAQHMIEEFDQNGDGKLSKTELPDRMQAMFNQMDVNKDGFVTQDELVNFLRTRGGGFGRPAGDRPLEPR